MERGEHFSANVYSFAVFTLNCLQMLVLLVGMFAKCFFCHRMAMHLSSLETGGVLCCFVPNRQHLAYFK